jgi:hypothetical protein
MSRYIPFEHKHRFTNIAAETSDRHEDGSAKIWQWCICCGVLKLDKEIFSPGPNQKATLLSDFERFGK